jgi:hypothetical protein
MASCHWEDWKPRNLPPFDKSLGGRYKHIRKRYHGKPELKVYAHQRWCLQHLESTAEQGLINLFYSDESQVLSQGYVLYGWQFLGEEISIVPS